MERLKKLVKQATHRKIPFLMLFEALFVLWLYFNKQTMLTTHWLHYGLGLVSLGALTACELRQDLPLPFMNHLGTEDFRATFAIGLALSFAIMLLGGMMHCYREPEPTHYCLSYRMNWLAVQTLAFWKNPTRSH